MSVSHSALDGLPRSHDRPDRRGRATRPSSRDPSSWRRRSRCALVSTGARPGARYDLEAGIGQFIGDEAIPKGRIVVVDVDGRVDHVRLVPVRAG